MSSLVPVGSRWRWEEDRDARSPFIVEVDRVRYVSGQTATMGRAWTNEQAGALGYIARNAVRQVSSRQEIAFCVLQGIRAELQR